MAHSDPTPARPSASHGSRGLLGSHWRRLGAALSVLLVGITVMALVPTLTKASGPVGVKSYYLGLGDSLAFGYQPNGDWSQGYVQQWYAYLHTNVNGSLSLTNYGCPGETSTTFIYGGCPSSNLPGSQLDFAVSFIKFHAGQVSPVSLDIGANDVLPDIGANCTINTAKFDTDLATLDHNLTKFILPSLVTALGGRGHARTGDLVMMNYYDPFQPFCSTTDSYVHKLNAHLASDAGQFGVRIADVFTPFSGDICTYTWMCSVQDIHPTTTGYGVITTAFENDTGY